MASRKGSDSISPTVPPISTMATSEVGADLAHGGLNLVGNVRDDLDGFAEVVAAPLLGDDLFVDAAGGEVVIAGEVGVGKALVVAEIEVGFGAVIGDEDLAVLEGRHGAGVDVEVGVELHEVDAEAAGLEQAADGGRGESFAERRHDAAGYKDVFCRHLRLRLLSCLDLPLGWGTVKYRRGRGWGQGDGVCG